MKNKPKPNIEERPSDFIYIQNHEQIIFSKLESGELLCPICGKAF